VGPDRLWVADITYVPTWAGFLYLAVVLDAWSRRVVGWAMATHLRTELVLEALNMAHTQRRPTAVIHHSDQGGQYTSIAFGQRCREMGVRPSMGSVGDAYDNALCESFFATLECELLDRPRFQSQAEARMAIFWSCTQRRTTRQPVLSARGREHVRRECLARRGRHCGWELDADQQHLHEQRRDHRRLPLPPMRPGSGHWWCDLGGWLRDGDELHVRRQRCG
jgi:transposase InsO family protein